MDAILPYIWLLVAGGMLIVGATMLRLAIAALSMSQAEYDQIRRDDEQRKRLAIFYRVRRR